MGLLVSIHRGDYDSEMNVFYGKRQVTVVNVEGPFEPREDAPAAKLVKGYGNTVIIVPADSDFDGAQMFGGTFGATSDSRFQRAVEEIVGVSHFAVSIHDRRETWAQYQQYSN